MIERAHSTKPINDQLIEAYHLGKTSVRITHEDIPEQDRTTIAFGMGVRYEHFYSESSDLWGSEYLRGVRAGLDEVFPETPAF